MLGQLRLMEIRRRLLVLALKQDTGYYTVVHSCTALQPALRITKYHKMTKVVKAAREKRLLETCSLTAADVSLGKATHTARR